MGIEQSSLNVTVPRRSTPYILAVRPFFSLNALGSIIALTSSDITILCDILQKCKSTKLEPKQDWEIDLSSGGFYVVKGSRRKQLFFVSVPLQQAVHK